MVKDKRKIAVNVGIVATRFNDFISKSLLNACLMELKRQGVKDASITTIWVPGAVEAPLAAKKLLAMKKIDAVICLGAVIRGDTFHFEVVANESARGMMDVALSAGKPVINGILTTDTIDQAQKRARDKGGANKGRDAAAAAMDMIVLLKHLK